MYFRGHLGLTLLVLSLFAYLLNFRGYYYLVIIVLSAGLASLPDIDLKLEIPHRKYTHNVFVALLLSLLTGYISYRLVHDFTLGFLPLFLAFILHIVGDLITYKPFKPLAPFQKRATSFKIVHSSNRFVNNALLILGIAMFSIYLVYVVTGLRIHELITIIRKILG